MAINADQARERTAAGKKVSEARVALEKLAEQRAFEEKVVKHVGFAQDKLDAAIIKAANDGLTACSVWFPEHQDLMRKVVRTIRQEYTDLGYTMGGGVIEDSRFNKYAITLDWGKS